LLAAPAIPWLRPRRGIHGKRIGAVVHIACLEGTSPLRLLEQCATEVIFQSDEEICRRGSTARYYWRVIEGCVRTFNLTGDGRRQIEDFLLPGDVLGLDHLRTAPSAAEAVIPSKLRCYPRTSADALAAQDPALRTHLRALTIMSLHRAYLRMLLLSRKNAIERVASFLLEMDSRTKTNSLQLPMGRADIADFLGLTTESVSRALTQLAQTAAIELSRGSVELLDRDSLADQARKAA